MADIQKTLGPRLGKAAEDQLFNMNARIEGLCADYQAISNTMKSWLRRNKKQAYLTILDFRKDTSFSGSSLPIRNWLPLLRLISTASRPETL